MFQATAVDNASACTSVEIESTLQD